MNECSRFSQTNLQTHRIDLLEGRVLDLQPVNINVTTVDARLESDKGNPHEKSNSFANLLHCVSSGVTHHSSKRNVRQKRGHFLQSGLYGIWLALNHVCSAFENELSTIAIAAVQGRKGTIVLRRRK
jgi:hypothetical protein